MKTICYFPKKVYFEEAILAPDTKVFVKNDSFNQYCYKDKDGEIHNQDDLWLVD